MSKFETQAECALKLLTESVGWEWKSAAAMHEGDLKELLAWMAGGLTARNELTH